MRLAQALRGSSPLEGIYAKAGDMNENDQIDLSDLTLMAALIENGAPA